MIAMKKDMWKEDGLKKDRGAKHYEYQVYHLYLIRKYTIPMKI